MILQKLSARRRDGRGFTLVELAIVLAVASLLFAGLWRLMAGGNTQLRDQAAADMQKKFISATKSYLVTSEGQDFLKSLANDATVDLFLDGRATVPVTASFSTNFLLPAGLNASTKNSYGQTFSIRVKAHRNPTTSTGVPESYSFMVLTNIAAGATAIPDTSGGRIASMIGGDGGFVYSTIVCGGVAADMACGAYGGWAVATTAAGYGFPAAGAGRVASRSFSGSDSAYNDIWLARRNLFPPSEYNTMHTPMFFEAIAGNDAVGPTGSNLYMQGNTIFLNKGRVNGGYNSGALGVPLFDLSMENLGRVEISLGGQNAVYPAAINNTNAALTITSAGPRTVGSNDMCQRTGPSDNSCPKALWVKGDVTIENALLANVLYSETFVYSPSSDMHLKHNIRIIENALDKMSKIRGVEFKLNQNNEDKFGVIAQEVEKVFPQLVVGKTDGNKGVDYMGLIGPMIAAINELKHENDALREQAKEQAVAIKNLQKIGLKK